MADFQTILLAPDSFKGTFSAPEVCRIWEVGLREAGFKGQIEACPVADGGEGTVEVLTSVRNGEVREHRVSGPLGKRVRAKWGLLPEGKAVIEVAQAVGLPLLPPEGQDPLRTTSRGVGELVRVVLEEPPGAILIGVGGTSSVDGGTGMARALGYRFLDESGRDLEEGGGELAHLFQVIPPENPAIQGLPVLGLCDVTNPLLGAQGAARVFAPQKGASPADVERLEGGLEILAQVVARDLGVEAAELRGAGAGGGIGFGVAAFLGGSLHPGIDLVMDEVGFERRLKGADLVITGEGSFDAQTSGGKAVAGVVRRSREAGVPVVVLCGAWEGTTRLDGVGRILSGADLGKGDSPLGEEELKALAALALRARQAGVS